MTFSNANYYVTHARKKKGVKLNVFIIAVRISSTVATFEFRLCRPRTAARYTRTTDVILSCSLCMSLVVLYDTTTVYPI